MSNNTLFFDPSGKLPVISFEDEKIAINGVSFAEAMLITDLTELLGTPDIVENVTYGWDPKDSTYYCWLQLGISALASPGYVNEPNGQGTTQRVRNIRLLFHPDMATRWSFANDWGIDNEPKPNRIDPFSGRLKICGTDFVGGMTTQQLVSVKHGKPLLLPEDSDWARTAFDDCCVIMVAPGSRRLINDVKNDPVGIVHLFLKRWRPSSHEFSISTGVDELPTSGSEQTKPLWKGEPHRFVKILPSYEKYIITQTDLGLTVIVEQGYFRQDRTCIHREHIRSHKLVHANLFPKTAHVDLHIGTGEDGTTRLRNLPLVDAQRVCELLESPADGTVPLTTG